MTGVEDLLRRQFRVEMTDGITAITRRHLAIDGANRSLRAVTRDLGLVSSASYRYFASRDDLTALILDAYNALGESVEEAEAVVARGALTDRWMAACSAVRLGHWNTRIGMEGAWWWPPSASSSWTAMARSSIVGVRYSIGIRAVGESYQGGLADEPGAQSHAPLITDGSVRSGNAVAKST